MTNNSAHAGNSSPLPRRRSLWQWLLISGGVLILLYLAVAYVVLPAYWKLYAKRHPSLDDLPGITYTAAKDGIPGDPLNVALIGTKAQVITIMLAAHWHPADAITLDSCLEIARATVFKRPDLDAPVSDLFLFGRKQDLAFEYPVGDNPRQRHHVRLWKSPKVDEDGRPIWVGAAIYDRGVGFSHKTGQITHHIGAAIDAERDKLFHDLKQTGDLADFFIEKGFHKVLEGRNGGGDPWHTDGDLYAGVIKADLKAGP